MRQAGSGGQSGSVFGAFWWLLVTGDALCFLLFAALGHNQHGESGGIGSIIAIALPFIVAWLVVAPWRGAFQTTGVAARNLLRRTVVAWLCAWPIALFLRAAVQHRGIALSFDLIALAANSVFLLGWRVAFALMTRSTRAA